VGGGNMHKSLLLSFVLTFLLLFLPGDVLADQGEILFHDVVGKSFSIFRVRPDGSGLREVIKYGAYPVWSRNRKKIAYMSLTPTQSPHSAKLGISDSEGKRLFEVEGIKISIKDEEQNLISVGYEWSHDGNQLAFATILRNRLHLQIFDIRSKKIGNICQKEIEDVTRAYFDNKIVWAFDDKHIFFISGGGGIEVIDLQSGGIGYVIPPGVPSDLSQGEEKIIFAFQRGEFVSFWSINKQGKRGDDFEIKGKIFPVSGPVKNKLLVEERSPDKISRTYLLNLESRRKEEIQGQNIHFFALSLSPMGDKVIAVGLKQKEENDVKEEEAEAGYYILDLRTGKIALLRKFLQPRDKGYWMNVYMGKRRDYSWR
jgi:hypothetical protein